MWVKPAHSAQHTVGLQQIHVTLFKFHEPRVSKASCQESDPTLTTYQVFDLGTLTSMCLDLLSVKWGSNSTPSQGGGAGFLRCTCGEQESREAPRKPQRSGSASLWLLAIAVPGPSSLFLPGSSRPPQATFMPHSGVCERPHGFLWVCPALLLLQLLTPPLSLTCALTHTRLSPGPWFKGRRAPSGLFLLTKHKEPLPAQGGLSSQHHGCRAGAWPGLLFPPTSPWAAPCFHRTWALTPEHAPAQREEAQNCSPARTAL